MHPILFQFGELKVHTYGVLMEVALLVAGVLLVLGTVKLRPGVVPIFLIGILGVPALALGAKLPNLLDHWGAATSNPVSILGGGMYLLPALVCVVLLGVASALVARAPPAGVLDVLAVAFAGGIAIGRVGCFMGGCCFGRPSAAPWAVVFPPSELLPPELHGVPVHPLQLYHAVTFLLLAVGLSVLAFYRRFPGQLALLGVSVFCAQELLDTVVRWSPEPPSIPGTLAWAVVTAFFAAVLAKRWRASTAEPA